MKKGSGLWKGFLTIFTASALVFVAVSCSSSTSPTPPSPTTGSIQVNSTPTGAKVFLDGTDTGRTTNTTLTNVSTGSHTVKLVKDGYADHTGSVSVTAGQTATVSASLTKNTITVTAPASGAVLQRNVNFDIQWQVGTTMAAPASASAPGRLEQGFADRLRLPAGRRSGVQAEAGGVEHELRIQTQDPATALRPGDRRLAARPGTAAAGAEPVGPDLGASPIPVIGFRQGQDAQVVTPLSDTRVMDIANVKIELWKGTSKQLDIVASTANDGSHSWQVPASLADGTDYKIRILCATDESVYGDSGNFSIAEPAMYVFDLKWGTQGSGDGQLDAPGGIAVDSSGYVYVCDSNNGRIQKFTAAGDFVSKWGTWGSGQGQFASPLGIAIDGSGYIYVADFENNRIQKFTAAGAYVTHWDSYSPRAVAVDSSDNVYVVEVSNHQIQKFTSSGTYVTHWGTNGSGDGQFSYPTGIAIDGSDNVYVADSGNYRVQKFTPDGTFVTKWGGNGSGDGQLSLPIGIAVDGSGDVYVIEFTNNHRIQKFTSSGTFVAKWGSEGTGDGQFTQAYGIAVDAAGYYVYAIDQWQNRVQRFRKAG